MWHICPFSKETNFIPSVLFSSFKNRPVGSLEAGTPDRMHARKIMSFNILCLLVRPALLLHDNPWMPKASTIAPQGQPWGAHKFTPSLKPIATRTASSSSLKPQDETGLAFNQSPLCGACAARRRALLMSSEHDPKRHCRACCMEASSQDLCLTARLESGVGQLYLADQIPTTPSTNPSRGWKFTGSKAAWVGSVAAAEAKKAEGASKATLRIPKPPHLTGKFACIQCWSDSSQLEILPKIARCNSSNRTSAGWEAHGDALRMYWTLVDPKEFLRITRESWEEMYDIRSEALWRSSHFALRTESMAAPSIRGAPRRTASLGCTNLKPWKLGGKLSGKESEISSHLLLLRLRPISEPMDSTMATSWATVDKSPPPDTSSRYPTTRSELRALSNGLKAKQNRNGPSGSSCWGPSSDRMTLSYYYYYYIITHYYNNSLGTNYSYFNWELTYQHLTTKLFSYYFYDPCYYFLFSTLIEM